MFETCVLVRNVVRNNQYRWKVDGRSLHRAQTCAEALVRIAPPIIWRFTGGQTFFLYFIGHKRLFVCLRIYWRNFFFRFIYEKTSEVYEQ